MTQIGTSDMTNIVDDVTVNLMNTDGVSSQEETEWINSDWSKWWGYFNSIPDLQSALLMKSAWITGKGYTADPETTVILDHVTGMGKDTFRDILFNMDVIRNVGGDSFAEIIRADDGTLLNLKPLDPSTIKIILNSKGRIIRYEQINKLGTKTSQPLKFKPNEIFHLSANRLADSIHGISKIYALEQTILADNESFTDIKKLMHHQARPFILWKLKTDDPVKIAQIRAKIDAARNLGEDTFIPDDDDAISYEIVALNPSSMIFEWRNDTRNKFYRSIGLPQIVPGAGGQSTESESKVIYLAFEQLNENDQKYIEDQVWNQLNLRINLIPPATLSQDLQADQGKDGVMTPQPSDTTAGVGR